MHGVRVLLVDDSDVVRDVSRSVLEDAGLVVEEAADGAVAVAMMQENAARCQLILMDVQMPHLDGIAATRAIRRQLGDLAPPIIALTAQAHDGEKQLCREAGMCDHVGKPVDPQQLIDVVRRSLPSASMSANAVQTAVAVRHSSDAAEPPLPDLPGFEWKAGLHSVSGKVSLLRTLLLRFANNASGVPGQLRALIAARDYVAARRVAHNLKGTAATLGGAAISQGAAHLEQCLLKAAEAAPQAETAIDLALAQLEDQLRRALPGLQALSAAPAEATPPIASDAELPESAVADYRELRELLAGNRYAARKAFAALRGKLGADDLNWRGAAEAVDVLDFERALAHLDARYPEHARL